MKYESQARYDAANTRMLTIKLNNRTDADILSWLNTKDNRQGAVKGALRKAIEAEGRDDHAGSESAVSDGS